jgi:3-oxoacyl-[acyl-carrier protein] reductase
MTAPEHTAPDGKVAIVTGASRGIGRAVAERLGRDGLAVVVNYQRSRDAAEEVAKAVTAAGGRAVTAPGDVGVPADVRALFDVAEREFGGVDVVVSNAAAETAAPFESTTEADFDRMVSVNLKGAFVAGQEAARRMRDDGRVINLSAILPATAIAMLGVYGATKAGVEVLTRSLAHQLGPRGITVNAVAPGLTDTDLLHPQARASLPQITAATPLGRLGQPTDIAAVIAFLASDDAAWITGQTIHANGGLE